MRRVRLVVEAARGRLTAFAGLGGRSCPAEPIKTLRLDYYHTGTAKSETFAVDRVVVEPRRGRAIRRGRSTTPTSASISSRSSTARPNRVVYSRGFSSIFGEWETTDEAQRSRADVPGVAAIPDARARRSRSWSRSATRRTLFREVWTTTIDPADSSSITADAAVARAGDRAAEERRSGHQGRSADSRRRLHRGRAARSSRRTPSGSSRSLFATVAIQGTASRDFNVWGLCPPAAESGISRPSHGRPPAVAGRRHLRRVRIPSATSSRSTTARFATPPRSRRTTSSRSS